VRLTGQLDHNDPSLATIFSDYTSVRVADSGAGQTGNVTESYSKFESGTKAIMRSLNAVRNCRPLMLMR